MVYKTFEASKMSNLKKLTIDSDMYLRNDSRSNWKEVWWFKDIWTVTWRRSYYRRTWTNWASISMTSNSWYQDNNMRLNNSTVQTIQQWNPTWNYHLKLTLDIENKTATFNVTWANTLNLTQSSLTDEQIASIKSTPNWWCVITRWFVYNDERLKNCTIEIKYWS